MQDSSITQAAQATAITDPLDMSSALDDKYKIPLVFMRETHLFGQRKPERHEWIQHVELYKALGERIDMSHIKGLQRVRGMWRIYLDNLQDKVTLMSEGVPLRGKRIPVLNTNPNRLDGEETIRIRVKNIPLSVDDGLIKRTLTLKKLDVISLFREKLRVDSKLTNCETGDRIAIVKASSLEEPLPYSMMFSKYTARVIHPGQQKRAENKAVTCSKCLRDGHLFATCPNEWVCTNCNESGHKRVDCKAEIPAEKESLSKTSDEEEESESESEAETESEQPQIDKAKASDGKSEQTAIQTDRRKLKPQSRADKNRQQSMDRFMTPSKPGHTTAVERSPPTPAEELHDKSMGKKKHRGKKHK